MPGFRVPGAVLGAVFKVGCTQHPALRTARSTRHSVPGTFGGHPAPGTLYWILLGSL